MNSKQQKLVKQIIFSNEHLIALNVKDNGFQAFNTSGSKHYMNVDIATIKMINWCFDTHKVYVSISLGEDSLEGKWWEANFKLKGKEKSVYADTAHEVMLLVCEYLTDQQ